MKNVMKKAHEITKNIIRKGDSYRATFKLALSLAHSLVKKLDNKIIEYKTSKGSTVKVKLEGKKISYLSLNGLEILTEVQKYCFVSSHDNMIHIDRFTAKRKLNLDGEVKIGTCDKLMSMFIKAEKSAAEEMIKNLKMTYCGVGNSSKVLGDFHRFTSDINYLG